MKKLLLITIIICSMLLQTACSCNESSGELINSTDNQVINQATNQEPTTSNDVQLTKTSEGFYKPKEFSEFNMLKKDSKWSWDRYSESEHFFVFWESEFGDSPNSSLLPKKMRVNIKDLLEKAEEYYDTYVNVLKFEGSQYKLQIYLLYQDEWLATGAGYDDAVGALWVNPSTCQPVGSTIAHEIGHSFQYLIYCNQLKAGKNNEYKSGFRYGYPSSNGGNGFWEQTAQWQALYCYPDEIFTWYHMDTWFKYYNKAFENERIRYESYWLHFYLMSKYGEDCISKIWKESNYPEDSMQCFTRLYLDNNLDKYYELMYDYASHMATFDIEIVKKYVKEERKRYETKLYDLGDGYKQVAYESCPEANGFNVIPIDNYSKGQRIEISFKGLPQGSELAKADIGEYKKEEAVAGKTTKYNNSNIEPGYRYGFCALLDDGTRAYGDMYSDNDGLASFNIPSNAKELYFIVLGAPKTYVVHAWDEDELTDVQLPYKYRIIS